MGHGPVFAEKGEIQFEFILVPKFAPRERELTSDLLIAFMRTNGFVSDDLSELFLLILFRCSFRSLQKASTHSESSSDQPEKACSLLLLPFVHSIPELSVLWFLLIRLLFHTFLIEKGLTKAHLFSFPLTWYPLQLYPMRRLTSVILSVPKYEPASSLLLCFLLFFPGFVGQDRARKRESQELEKARITVGLRE